MTRRRGIDIILLLLALFICAAPARAGMVTLTFDDGFASVAAHAFPVLQKYGLPAVAGVIVSKMESNDPDFMRPADLLRLQKAGWEIASHSLSHRRCLDLPARYGQEPVRDARRDARNPRQFDAVYEYPVLAGLLSDGKPLRRVAARGAVGETPGSYYYDDSLRRLFVRPFQNAGGKAPDLDAVSYERELQGSRRRLEGYGFKVESFIAPFNAWTPAMRDLSFLYYRQAVSGGDGANPRGGSDRLWIRRYNVLAATTLAELQDIILKEAVEKDGWVVFCLHGVGAGAPGWEPYPREKLEALARWLSERKVPVVTLARGARILFETPSVQRAKGETACKNG